MTNIFKRKRTGDKDTGAWMEKCQSAWVFPSGITVIIPWLCLWKAKLPRALVSFYCLSTHYTLLLGERQNFCLSWFIFQMQYLGEGLMQKKKKKQSSNRYFLKRVTEEARTLNRKIMAARLCDSSKADVWGSTKLVQKTENEKNPITEEKLMCYGRGRVGVW